MNNNRNRMSGLSFLAGVIVGGATLYYLNTPQGKELTRKAKEKGIEYSNLAKETAVDMSNKAKSKASDLANQAQSLANELKSKAEETIVSGKSTIDNVKNTIQTKVGDLLPDNTTKSDFKAGVARAKANIKNGAQA